jgi:DNA repair exonuclease SbcCD ATPase subunit
VTDDRRREILAAAGQLERADLECAAALDVVDGLGRRVGGLRDRIAAVRQTHERVPAELAQLEQLDAEERDRLERAQGELSAARKRLAGLGSTGNSEALEAARRAVERGDAAVSEAAAALERLAGRREELRAEERGTRAEADEIEADARRLAGDLREAPRLSANDVDDPDAGLDGADAWAERAQAGLLVVRTGLEQERERTVREAAELGASALSEPVGPAGVAAIRRRLERELGSS